MNKIFLWLSFLSAPFCWFSEADGSSVGKQREALADDPVFEASDTTKERLANLKRERVVWERESEELQKMLDDCLRDKEGIASLVLSELLFVSKGDPTHGFFLTLTNQSKHTIARVELIAELTSGGRTVPWAKDNIVWKFPGGLMPGEERSAHFIRAADELYPEKAESHRVCALSRWWAQAPQRTDYRLRVRLLAAYDESCDIFEESEREDTPLWQVDDGSLEKYLSDRLKEFRAKIARADRVIAELSCALRKENEADKPAAR